MMPDFIEELATKRSLMRVALTLKMMRTMTPEGYDEVSNIPLHQSREKATQLVYTLYRVIARKPKNSYEIKSVLTRIADMGGLVKRWEDAGKNLYF